MCFSNDVTAVVRACNYTHARHYVRKHLTMICSVIGSRIDYCNSLLYGALVAVIDKLQMAKNNIACVICHLSAVQMHQQQAVTEVATLAACLTAHPVQAGNHQPQGTEGICTTLRQ